MQPSSALGVEQGFERVLMVRVALFCWQPAAVFFYHTKSGSAIIQPAVVLSHSKSVPATASRNDALWLGYRSLWLGYRLAELAQGRDDDSHQ